MFYDSKIYVAGHTGMVGSAIVRSLKSSGYKNLILEKRENLDLMNYEKVIEFFKNNKPEYVFIAAAKVGGILANNEFKGEFIFENLSIQNNIIHSAHLSKVKKLLFLGSSCIYPKNSIQPIKEESLLSGFLEKTNEPYSIAKIAGIKLCESYYDQYSDNFISAMPTNLYGPNDNFDLSSSHVLPALINKFHRAKINNNKQVVVWGSGKPLREFLYVDDLSEACIFIMKNINPDEIYSKNRSTINVGTEEEISIKDLAKLVKKSIGFNGEIIFDKKYPDGTMRKLMDSNRLKSFGWKSKTKLADGIKSVYSWYLNSYLNKIKNN